jgi:hypothetical protein
MMEQLPENGGVAVRLTYRELSALTSADYETLTAIAEHILDKVGLDTQIIKFRAEVEELEEQVSAMSSALHKLKCINERKGVVLWGNKRYAELKLELIEKIKVLEEEIGLVRGIVEELKKLKEYGATA